MACQLRAVDCRLERYDIAEKVRTHPHRGALREAVSSVVVGRGAPEGEIRDAVQVFPAILLQTVQSALVIGEDVMRAVVGHT